MVKAKLTIKALEETMNDIEKGRVKAHYGGPLFGTFMAIIIYTPPQMQFISYLVSFLVFKNYNLNFHKVYFILFYLEINGKYNNLN